MKTRNGKDTIARRMGKGGDYFKTLPINMAMSKRELTKHEY